MRYNVFNPTDKVIREHINGEEIEIQPLSCASVTEKKTNALMKLRPELTLGHTGQYTEADLAILRTLKKDRLLEVAVLLARNVPVNLADYAAPEKETKADGEDLPPENAEK